MKAMKILNRHIMVLALIALIAPRASAGAVDSIRNFFGLGTAPVSQPVAPVAQPAAPAVPPAPAAPPAAQPAPKPAAPLAAQPAAPAVQPAAPTQAAAPAPISAACPIVFAHGLPAEAAWRENITQRSQIDTNGQQAPVEIKTSPARENRIQRTAENMKQFVLGQDGVPGYGGIPGDVPFMQMAFEDGIQARMTQSPDYDQHKIAIYDVGNIGADDMLRLTLIGPASGHVGSTKAERNVNAKRFAKDDLISVYYTKSGIPGRVFLLKDVPSLELVTFMDLAIPLKAGESVQIFYVRADKNRRDSAGVGGFLAGRSAQFNRI